MPKLVSIRPTYKILTSNYLSITLLFFASYADFFRKKLDPANITELFWQLRPYVVLHHVEFKESSFSFSSVGIINFVDIVGFVRKNDTLGILLRNGCFYLFSAVSMDRQCILVCDPEFYKQTGRRLGGWSLFVAKRQLLWWKIKEYLHRNIF